MTTLETFRNQFNVDAFLSNLLSRNIMPLNHYKTDYNLADVFTPKSCSAVLFLLHTNIKSLQKNLEIYIMIFLQTLIHLSDIICFSETKLKDSSSVNIDLARYEPLINADSKTNAGGLVHLSL